MIRVVVKQGSLGQEAQAFDLPSDCGITPRDLLDRFAPQLPQANGVDLAVDGRIVGGDAADQPLRDGQQVFVMPRTADVVGILVAVLINIAVAYAVNYVASILSPRPKPQGEAQERGDETSQTYAWDGIKTNYGPGLPIPWMYGRHALGGQVIWTDVLASRSSNSASLDDRLRIVLSLCEGPIHRFGNVAAGSIDAMGGIPGGPSGVAIPDHLRVNGTLMPIVETHPGVMVWLRPGTMDQPQLPAPFTGVATTESLNVPLTPAIGTTYIHTIPDAKDLAAIRCVVAFPGGLYATGPTGQPIYHPASMAVYWRVPGSIPGGGTPGNFGTLIFLGGTGGSLGLNGPFVGYHAATWSANTSNVGFPVGVSGPIELVVWFTTPPGATVIANAVLRELTLVRSHTLRYPREALLGLELIAGARFSGGQPQVTLRCDGALVRVWDATNGWSPRCWDVPAAPFNFNTHPPGRNPAWCLLDFLLADWGLGRWISETQLDLPAFRRWAAFCDSDPNPGDPWGEPQCTVDLVGDQPRPAWDWVLAFCSAGRATPVMRNGKISIVYQFRDSHGDAGITVPAKAPLQLLTSGNCENVRVNWLPKKNRATVFEFQFLNEDDAYAQDTLPVEDDVSSTMNDPTSPFPDEARIESIQAYGVTRPSQLFREGVWRHRIQKQVEREITGTTGPWALAAEKGDLFDFEHELLRPFSADVPLTMQVITGGSSTTDIVIDHHLSGTGLQFVGRDPDGAPARSLIDSYTNITVGGRPQCEVSLATPCTVSPGATCVVGLADKLTQTYELVAVETTKELKRDFRGLQWTPDAYDPITQNEFLGLLEAGDSLVDGPIEPVDIDELPPSVVGISLVGELDGSHRITWARPGSKVGTWARVYVRPADIDGAWILVGSTELNEVPVRGLRVGQAIVVSVCLENRRGDPVPPDLGDQLTVTPEEFPTLQLPAVTNLRANILDQNLLIQWDEIAQRDLDYFEVRSGSSWAAAAIVARERAPRAVLANPPAGPVFLVAARSVSGLYGPIVSVANPNWTPPTTVQVLLEDDLAPSPAGTHTNTQWNGTDLVIELAAGAVAGTYESLAQDMGYQAPFFWQVRIDRQEVEDLTVGDLTFAVGSGEARWRTVEGRPASPASPGIDWQTLVQDLAIPIGDLPSTMLVGGHVGEVGSHTQVLVESRFHVNGSWTSWKPHLDRVVVARQIQVRLKLNRRSLSYRVRVKQLAYAVFL